MRKKIIVLIAACIALLQTGCIENPFAPIFDFGSSEDLVLFYAISMENNEDIGIYITDPGSQSAKLILQGPYGYPIWKDLKHKIAYQNLANYSIEIRSLDGEIGPVSECVYYPHNVLFMHFSAMLSSYLFSSQDGGMSGIAAMDRDGENFRKISQSIYPEANPVISQFGQWIYFTRKLNGFHGIYRMDQNGENCREILSCRANLNTFSVSYDGSLIVSPRYVENEGDIIVVDLESNQILHEISPSVPGIPLYTSFSSDNRTVYFVNGFQNDYSKPRNLYRVDIDGSNLEQLTHFTDKIASRPLAW